MKKVISMLTAMTVMMCLLVGCNSSKNNQTTDTGKDVGTETGNTSGDSVKTDNTKNTGEGGNTEDANTGNSEWTGEVDHIIMTYLTLGTTPADLLKVQDAVNQMTIPKIGVEVELKPVSAYDAFAQFPLWLGTGERIDLMMPLLQDLNTYVNQGLIEPLDELIETAGPYIDKLTEEGYPVAANNRINGETYAITSVANMYGIGGSYLIDKKYVEEVGMTCDPKKVYTMDELTELFAKLKKAHPDMYPCGIVTTGRTSSEFIYTNGVYDNLGAKDSSGSLVGTDSTAVVNLYESEEYKEYLNYLEDWYQAGYIYPDVATTDASALSLVNAGAANGYFMVSAPIQKGKDQDQFRLSPVYYGSQGMGGWVIPITSKEPEAAMRFINMMLEDAAIANLLQWGIEGEHYVVLDESINLIGFPEGVDAGTSGYYNTLGLYGDARKMYIWNAEQRQEINDAYTEEAMANPTQGVGFVYNPASQLSRISAVQAVLAQYLPALESGSVNLDTYYPEFISALKSAGMDAVIADKQKQFDEWRALK